ncbi:MAG: methyltransferase domain-containing protein [Chloroflexota bacterium]
MGDAHHEYDDQFVAGLEWMWGNGFLSPGGPEEVAAILEGIDLAGKTVLDIGSGIGGIDLLLVKKHGAKKVIGIDVEAPLIARSNEMVRKAGLTAEQIEFRLVEPGPLPFENQSFDLVFSKDSMIHIPNKQAIYADIYRVLKPNGRLAFSDWFGSEAPSTPEFEEWLRVVGLTFKMGTIDTAVSLLHEIGFINVEAIDRNQWYAQNILEELATLDGENYDRLVTQEGEPFAKQRLKSSSLKKQVVDQGLLRPGHIRGIRP